MKPYLCRNNNCPNVPFYVDPTELPPPVNGQPVMPPCPKCSTNKQVHRGAVVHLIIADDNGPFSGHHGKYKFGCEIAKRLFSKGTGPERVSNVYDAVTCHECLTNNEKPTEDVSDE